MQCHVSPNFSFSFSVPSKPTTLAVKAVENSEFKQATSNGIAKELKSSHTELMVETKDRVPAKKETFYITREAKESEQGQHQVTNTEHKEAKKGPQVLQKTSSTITLQSVKLQPESQAPSIRQGENRKRGVQLLMSAQQTPPLTGHVSPRTREAENRSGAWEAVMEEKREPLGIPPQFEIHPQSLEASEGQEVKFKSKGKGMKIIGAPAFSQKGVPFLCVEVESNFCIFESCSPPKAFWNPMLFPQHSEIFKPSYVIVSISSLILEVPRCNQC